MAHAVAQEMHKVYKKELGPQPVPLTVPGEAVDEEEVSVYCSFHVLIITDLNLPLKCGALCTCHSKVAPLYLRVFLMLS